MKALMAVVLGMWLPALALAQAPFDFNQAKWNELKEYVLTHGEMRETIYGIFVTVSDITPPDVTKDHEADYLSAVGGFNRNGNFVAHEYHMVSETWAMNEPNMWTIDQWVFVIRPDGQLFRATHNMVVEDTSGRVYEAKTLPSTAEEVWFQWGVHMSEWGQRLPEARIYRY